MAMGRRSRQQRQQEFWIAATELPKTAAHPFYRGRTVGTTTFAANHTKEPCPSGAVKKSLWCAGRGWGRHPCLPVFKYLLAALAGKMPAPLISSQPLTVAARSGPPCATKSKPSRARKQAVASRAVSAPAPSSAWLILLSKILSLSRREPAGLRHSLARGFATLRCVKF